MVNKQLDLVIPVDQGFAELLASFQNNFYVKLQPETVNYRVFYDTFDWLLYNNGADLELHEEGQSRRIYWRSDRNARPRIVLGVNDVPHLASDLPESGFRQQLKKIISIRELVPRIKVKIKRQPMAVLDKHDKIVVRINFDEHWYFPSKIRAGTVLGKRIAIKPVKGYAEEFNRVVEFFQPLELREAHDNILKLALAESGISTTDYSTKLNLFLDLDEPAEQALKEILHRLLDIMQQNLAGCIRGRDTEFMHDYRVSIRKTRSALTQIDKVFPQGTVTVFNKFFSSLGKLTNPVRDLDVFQLKLEDYAGDLDKNARRSLQPLREYLEQSRAHAQKRFVETVKSTEYRDKIKEWREFLEDRKPTTPPLENTNKAVYMLADELIWEMYQLVLSEGNAITDDSEAEALHELRKTCKKLRYLMEFFQSLYPAREIRELIQALKGLQDNLGDYNDLDVHAKILKKYIKQDTDPDANEACRQVIDILGQRSVKTRNRFAERFAAFASEENQAEFKALFVESRSKQE